MSLSVFLVPGKGISSFIVHVRSIVTSVPLMLLHLPYFSGWESFLREDECEVSAFILLVCLCLVDNHYL